MILVLHIVVALLSVGFSAYAAVNPNSVKLKTAYALAGGTLGSGVLLVFLEPQTLTQACVSGLVYFAIVSVILAYAQKKFASLNI